MARAIVIPVGATGLHGSSHGAGASDPVQITQAQVTNLVSDLGNKSEVGHTHAATAISDSTATGRALITAADAAAGQAALNLTGATGDYNDLTNKPTLGDAAAKNTGTTAGTLAAGDDSRITGAAQKASNLSDLGSVSTARTNLGLGGAALLNVGTALDTVCAGDDDRLANDGQEHILWSGSAWPSLGALPSWAFRRVFHSEWDVSASSPLSVMADGDIWWPHPNSTIYDSV